MNRNELEAALENHEAEDYTVDRQLLHHGWAGPSAHHEAETETDHG